MSEARNNPEWKNRSGIYYCSECGWGLADPQSGEPYFMVKSANRSNSERWSSFPGWQNWMMNYCPCCGTDMKGKGWKPDSADKLIAQLLGEEE